MKFLSYVVLSLMICSLLPVTAMAEEVIEEPVVQEEPLDVSAEGTEQDIIVNINYPDPVEDPAVTEETEVLDELVPPSVASTYSVTDLDEYATRSVSDPEQQTMKDVVVMVLGEYTPRTQTVTQYLSDGTSESHTEIVSGVGGLDWEWISGAGLFGLVLFSFLKLVGVLLKNG